jgi:hypothetical protein
MLSGVIEFVVAGSGDLLGHGGRGGFPFLDLGWLSVVARRLGKTGTVRK